MTNNKYLDYASFLAYSIFIIIFFYQYLGPDRLPGDNGDGRMIIGVLENFYLAFNYENFSFLKQVIFIRLIVQFFFRNIVGLKLVIFDTKKLVSIFFFLIKYCFLLFYFKFFIVLLLL